MIYTTLSELKKRHKEIMTSYKSLPFYRRGFELCVLRCVLFVLWCYIWLESGARYLSLDYVYYDMTDPRLIIIPTLLVLIGIAIFKPQAIFTNRTYFGKIEKIEKQHAETITKNEKGVKVVVRKMASILYNGTNLITIRKPSGRLVQRKVPNLAFFDRLYDIDTSVSVINGVKFPVPMNRDVIPKDRCFCTKCGSFEKRERTRCSMCFSTLWYK